MSNEEVTEERKMGIFVTIEGPNGVGKSSFIKALNEKLIEKYRVFLTREPSETDFGYYVKNNEGQLSGEAYAYLIAADRCYHVENFVKPQLKECDIVISDRYIESSLVLQTFDGVEIEDIWRLNKKFPIPSLSIVLLASAETIQSRLNERDMVSHFEKCMTREEEIKGYKYCIEYLKDRNFNMQVFYNEKEQDMFCNVEKCVNIIEKIMEENLNG